MFVCVRVEHHVCMTNDENKNIRDELLRAVHADHWLQAIRILVVYHLRFSYHTMSKQQ